MPVSREVTVGPLRIGPTVRVDYRMVGAGSETDSNLLVVRPLVRFDLRFWDFVLDTELGFEWRRQEVDGATDDLGLHAVEDRLHIHDLHASILHLVGLDNMKLTWLHKGRPERPTINEGEFCQRLTGIVH